MGTDLRDLSRPEVDLEVSASAEAVWSVLGDGWLYPLWVVGATHMRDVDETWPAVGARLHQGDGDGGQIEIGKILDRQGAKTPDARQRQQGEKQDRGNRIPDRPGSQIHRASPFIADLPRAPHHCR